MNYLAEVVAKAFGVEPSICHLPERNEVQHAYSDHSKATYILGGRSSTSLEDGIHRMASWAKDVGARKSKFFGSIEVEKNMPLSWKAMS